MGKNGNNTREDNGRFKPGENGGAHGKAGRSGRLTDAVRTAAREAVEKHKLLEIVARIARKGKRDGDRISAAKLLLAYGYGQPEQRIEHTGEDGGPIEFVTEARESFAGRMDRLTARLGAAAFPEFPE